MILDQLASADLYRNLGPLFAKGFDYLKAFQPETPLGKYSLEGDLLVAIVQEYTTLPIPEKKWESHLRYWDIQYSVLGQETIYYSPINLLQIKTPYLEEKDVIYYWGKEDRPLLLQSGEFVIFGPQDGHKPGCLAGSPGNIRKVVLKVAVSG